MEEVKGRWRGHAAMLFANMVWGGLSPITKNVLESGLVNGLTLSGIRIIGATVLMVLVGLILPKSVSPRETIAKPDRIKIFFAGFLMITMNQAMYIWGISFTSPIDSSVMSTLTPVFTMVCAAIFIAMPITWMKALGVVLGLGGALLMVLAGNEPTGSAVNPVLGDTMCLIAQFCAALYYVLFKDIINRYSPFTLMKWMFISSSLTFGVVMLPWIVKVPYSLFTLEMWMSIVYIIVFATVIGYLLIPFSQRLLKPTVVSMYTYFQPVTAALLATIMGLAAFGMIKIASTILIFLGVWFVTRSK